MDELSSVNNKLTFVIGTKVCAVNDSACDEFPAIASIRREERSLASNRRHIICEQFEIITQNGQIDPSRSYHQF